jgi:cellulose synthase/poly-beta-1,6-N-acetylglucosamine synthase-like glycosyltransferase
VRDTVDGTEQDGRDDGAARPLLRLSVVVPARNEELSLGECLESLVEQSEPGFALGVEWELIVVDDDSSDGTRGIAEGIASGREGVVVMGAPALDLSERGGFTGKTNACWAGAQLARGAWILFTDADTVHEAGDLSRAVHEAEKYKVALLSYSPRQIVEGFWQRAVMPLVFSELASVYPPKQVSDPASRLAAANGQFLLVEREAYFAVGGHRGVGQEILEDVALARKMKRAKYGIRFRYAPEALAARMYRTLPEMVEGWTKNLALLFPEPGAAGDVAGAGPAAVLWAAGAGGVAVFGAAGVAGAGDLGDLAADVVAVLCAGGAFALSRDGCGCVDCGCADVLLAAGAELRWASGE